MKNKLTMMAASAGLLLGATSLVQAEGSKLDSVKTTLSSILAKEGISFSGEFRSEFHQGTIDDAKIDETSQTTTESVEFTSVDFAITARPNSNVSGTAIMRMHQDWRNFFGDIASPIVTRWVSIDGNFGDILLFNLGDFKTKYSPLTVWSNEHQAMYEADIFKQDRIEAQKELFLGDNERMMQGANLQLDASVDGMLDEVHFGVFGSRLRNSKAESKVTNANEVFTLEKFAFGTNLDFSRSGANLGGSFIKVFDRLSTFKGGNSDDQILARDLIAEDLTVNAIRGGFDLAGVSKSKAIFSLNGELAMASDNVGYLANLGDAFATVATDSTPAKPARGATDKKLEGQALLTTAKFGYANGNDYKAVATVNYIKNDKDFYNPLAQSTTIEVAHIMNIETDIVDVAGEQTYNVDNWTNHYSIYDNFHNNVFKFAPSAETNLWHKAPISKNGYTNETQNRAELNSYAKVYGFNGFTPAGLASSNRTGIVSNLKVDALNTALSVSGVFTMLEETEGLELSGFDETTGDLVKVQTGLKKKYSIMGGGLSIDIMKLMGEKKPLILSGSAILKTQKRDAEATYGIDEIDVEITMLNAGAYYNIWNKFSLLGGLQMTNIVNNTANVGGTTMKSEWVETAMAAGIEYKLDTGIYTVLKYTNLDVNKKLAEELDFSQQFIKAAIRVQF